LIFWEYFRKWFSDEARHQFYNTLEYHASVSNCSRRFGLRLLCCKIYKIKLQCVLIPKLQMLARWVGRISSYEKERILRSFSRKSRRSTNFNWEIYSFFSKMKASRKLVRI
jgi:hypothetical protein